MECGRSDEVLALLNEGADVARKDAVRVHACYMVNYVLYASHIYNMFLKFTKKNGLEIQFGPVNRSVNIYACTCSNNSPCMCDRQKSVRADAAFSRGECGRVFGQDLECFDTIPVDHV